MTDTKDARPDVVNPQMPDEAPIDPDAVGESPVADRPDNDMDAPQTSEEATDAAVTKEQETPVFEPTPIFGAHSAMPLTPEPSPDGAWLAYLLEGADGSIDLWLSPTDGGEPQRVELPFEPLVERDPDSGRLIRGPQWSPDGKSIAIAGSVEGEDRSAIWLVPSPVDSAATPIVVEAVAEDTESTEAESTSTDAAAEATDDTAELTSVATDADADSETVIGAAAAEVETVEETDAVIAPTEAEAAGADQSARSPRLLTFGPGSERSPRWTPDGQIIAFVSQRAGRDVIALATTAGDEPTIAEILTWSAQDDREPVWSRDGRFLAFTRQRIDGPEHADILVYAPEAGELTNLTEQKSSAVRHSLDWVAGRNLIAYVTLDGDWLSISVINSDNKAGWAVTRESGDKTDPRFHPTEARLVYVRTEGFATVCCERGLHASGAVALDPSEGVVYAPRWLQDKRVAYGFSAAQKPFGFLAQDNLASAERTTIQVPNGVDTVGAALRTPTVFEYPIGEDEAFSGTLYRSDGTVGPAPAIVYLPDGPLTIRRGEFHLEEQALASTGITVLAPLLHGATGFGAGVQQDLAEFAFSEIEASDIAEAGYALGEADDVDGGKLALVGVGFGGTLALLTAGARPGVYAAVVAIDPITDWLIELGEADPVWRNWVTAQYGMPMTNPDKYAMRTPGTFAAVIDVPLILVSTEAAAVPRQAQLEIFEAYLDANGVEFEHITVEDESLPTTLERVSRKLAATFRTGDDTLG